MAQLSDTAQDTIKLRFWQSKADAGKSPWLVEYRGEKRFFQTDAEALAHRDQIIVANEDGGYITKSNRHSVRFVVEEYTKHLESQIKLGIKTTGYKRNADCGIRALLLVQIDDRFLGDWLITDLTAGIIQNQVLPQLAQGRKSASVTRYFATLKSICNHAVLNEWLKRNPCSEAQVSQAVKKEAEYDIGEKISSDRISAIIAAAGKWKLHIAFAASTGLRSGEQRGLKWKHVDFDKGFVNVVQAAKFDNSVGAPKTKAAFRSVPLQDHILTALREHRLSSQWSTDDDFVFPNTTGGCLGMPRMLQDGLLPACKKAGVDPIRWHHLRHYYASKLLDALQDDRWTIQRLLGHSSINTTTKIYGHWLRSDEKDRVLKERVSGIQF